jgi:hypothetical protein
MKISTEPISVLLVRPHNFAGKFQIAFFFLTPFAYYPNPNGLKKFEGVQEAPN